MILTARELAELMGKAVRARRIALRLTQMEAASRSGISYSTWRRLEAHGQASIEDLARAAIVLRCERDLEGLFPQPIATSMDELLAAQRVKQAPKRVRAGRNTPKE